MGQKCPTPVVDSFRNWSKVKRSLMKKGLMQEHGKVGY